MLESFYERDGDLYLATELTRGPWDPGAEHAGPPAALIGREVERLGRAVQTLLVAEREPSRRPAGGSAEPAPASAHPARLAAQGPGPC